MSPNKTVQFGLWFKAVLLCSYSYIFIMSLAQQSFSSLKRSAQTQWTKACKMPFSYLACRLRESANFHTMRFGCWRWCSLLLWPCYWGSIKAEKAAVGHTIMLQCTFPFSASSLDLLIKEQRTGTKSMDQTNFFFFNPNRGCHLATGYAVVLPCVLWTLELDFCILILSSAQRAF